MSQNTKTLGRFQILRTLGSGATSKVKLAVDTETNQKVAIKILKQHWFNNARELINSEIEAMRSLQHDNIVQLVSYGEDKYQKKSGDRMVFYQALELAKGGELLDFIMHTGKLDEKYARYYMQ